RDAPYRAALNPTPPPRNQRLQLRDKRPLRVSEHLMGSPARAPGAARRGLIALLAATAAAFFAPATAARAYVIEGERWPGNTITYYPSAYKKAAARAAKTWNAAHVGVAFKRISDRSKANFVVAAGPEVHPCE